MSRRRRRRKTEKPKQSVPPEVASFAELAAIRQATRVKRLAYTRTQAAEVLGISTSTFERRTLPLSGPCQMDWGKRLIPIDELERFLAARRQARKEQPRRLAPGRKPGQGKSLRRIAHDLNTGEHGRRQDAVLARRTARPDA